MCLVSEKGHIGAKFFLNSYLKRFNNFGLKFYLKQVNSFLYWMKAISCNLIPHSSHKRQNVLLRSVLVRGQVNGYKCLFCGVHSRLMQWNHGGRFFQAPFQWLSSSSLLGNSHKQHSQVSQKTNISVCKLGVSPSLVSRWREGYSFWSI